MRPKASDRSAVLTICLGIIAIAFELLVWFLGFDHLWAIAIVLAVGTVIGASVSLGANEEAVEGAPQSEIPRGVRYDVATIAESLAACDRLARPRAVRRIRALLIPERDDLLARFRGLRRMHGLLSAELSDRGVDARDPANDAIVPLLGPESAAILHSNDSRPVTTASIERCLKAIEHLGTETI